MSLYAIEARRNQNVLARRETFLPRPPEKAAALARFGARYRTKTSYKQCVMENGRPLQDVAMVTSAPREVD
ncbi:MAG: hypothetical protein R3C25_06640 [Hyphomonadaceae bacterium]